MKNLKSILMAVGLGTMAASAFAQGTAFTYQGRLNSGANPANGSYDMAFSLFATNVAGTPIAGPVTNTAVPVTNGLFTTLVNFTNGFSGGSNWLQVAVSSNGLNAFNALLPRQQLTPVPYAEFASGVAGLIVQPNSISPNVILGYPGNYVSGIFAGTAIGGGGEAGATNLATGSFATIGGGYQNTAAGYATVGGGEYNVAASSAAIGGGSQNQAAMLATVGGGNQNNASGAGAFVGGGGYDGNNFGGNTASGGASVVSGGLGNQATANYATVPGGANNVAGGNDSFAAGQQAEANNQGAFVWADSQNAPFASTANNQFLIRAQGGVGIGTASPAKQLDVAGTASGVATSNSIDSSVFVRVDNTSTDGSTGVPDYAGIGFGHNSTRQAIVGGTFGNDYLDFYTGGALAVPKMRIDFSGHVGIGTTNPSTALQVNGTVTATSFSGSFAGSGSGLTGVALLAGGNAFTGQQTIMSGNVGLGITSPLAHLHVDGGIFESPVAAALFEVQNCGAACAIPTWTEAVRLENTEGNIAGEVGMGFLTIAAGSSLTNVPDAWIGTDDKASGNTHSFKIATQAGGVLTNRVFVNGATGNVGIGTTTPTTERLVVSGGVDVTTAASSPITDSGLGLSFETYGGRVQTFQNRPLVLNPSGNNVCIGTTGQIGALTVATSNGQLSIVGGPFTPELWSTGGSVPGHMRFRNALEVWPNTNITAAGYLDVRGTNGVQNIILDGSDGNITCVAINITSDRNAKEDFTPLDPREVLAKVAALPITEWQYKAEKAGDAAAARHIGPMAQDFRNAFTLGQDEKHISVVDEGGVALAAIQGLNEKLEETQAQNAQLKQTVNDLKNLVEQLKQSMAARQGE